MAEVVTGEEERLERERVFRFTMEFLEDVMNGQTWHLRRGIDFPRHWPLHTLRQRLYAAAHYRKGRIRLWQVDEDTFGFYFYEPPVSRTSTPDPEVSS